ncbi:MAG: hypothetical protein ACRD7E_09040, partial [Bryobacteraceae bacterium]
SRTISPQAASHLFRITPPDSLVRCFRQELRYPGSLSGRRKTLPNKAIPISGQFRRSSTPCIECTVTLQANGR